MMDYTCTIDELSDCGCVQCSIVNASLDADEVTLRFVYEELDAPPVPWEFLDAVTLTGPDGPLFTGYMLEASTAWAGSARYYDVTLKNEVALLDAIPAAQSEGTEEKLVNAADLIAAHLGEAGEVSLSSTILAPYSSGTESRWSVIASALRWVPDAASWCDPATGKLYIYRAGKAGAILTLDARAKAAYKEDAGQSVFTFRGISNIELTPRPDLVPPVCALTGKFSAALPAGGNPYQPYAFAYNVPREDLSIAKSSKGLSAADMDDQTTQAVQQVSNPWMLVKGRAVPDGWKSAEGTAVNMRQASGQDAKWLEFWQGFGAFRILKRISAGCLTFGNAVFEPVPAAEAYPEEDEGEDTGAAPSSGKLHPIITETSNAPANYKELTADNGGKLYVMWEGSFPASSDARANVHGLHFCRGCLKQFVWLSSTYSGTASKAEAQDFFVGSTIIEKKSRRYTCLQLEAIFIDRRRKRYQTGTNELSPDDEDYAGDDEDTGSGGDGGGDDGADDDLKEADYRKVLADYYAATRKLYYDGTVTLVGVQGYTPAALMGVNLNISGLAPEWATMQTPIQRAVYDPIARTLDLTLGSPEVLSFDELLHRQQIGLRQRLEDLRQAAAAQQSLSGQAGDTEGDDSGDGTPPDDGSEDNEEAAPMVSPSMTASHGASSNARTLEPFQVYFDEDSNAWMLNGGVLPSPAGYIEFEATNINSVWQSGRVFAVRARYDSASKSYKPQIVYKDKSSS